jgi:hypothetical protein
MTLDYDDPDAAALRELEIKINDAFYLENIVPGRINHPIKSTEDNLEKQD